LSRPIIPASAANRVATTESLQAEAINHFRNKICHVWTAPSWQGFSSRLQAGRCSHVFGLLARHTGRWP
jgi:hypothetical protein